MPSLKQLEAQRRRMDAQIERKKQQLARQVLANDALILKLQAQNTRIVADLGSDVPIHEEIIRREQRAAYRKNSPMNHGLPTAPVLSADRYHIELVMFDCIEKDGWFDHNREYGVLVSKRLEPRYREDIATKWELPHRGDVELEREFYTTYQKMWAEQRILLGYHLNDRYWGALDPDSDKGGYCTRPANQVLKQTKWGNGYVCSIKWINGAPMIDDGWCELEEEYQYLATLTGDDLITAIDAIILA